MTTDPGLAPALRRAAQAPILVIACDYDGTLAPFVDDPTRAIPAPGAIEALVRLAGLPRTTVALLSGRNRAGQGVEVIDRPTEVGHRRAHHQRRVGDAAGNDHVGPVVESQRHPGRRWRQAESRTQARPHGATDRRPPRE